MPPLLREAFHHDLYGTPERWDFTCRIHQHVFLGLGGFFPTSSFCLSLRSGSFWGYGCGILSRYLALGSCTCLSASIKVVLMVPCGLRRYAVKVLRVPDFVSRTSEARPPLGLVVIGSSLVLLLLVSSCSPPLRFFSFLDIAGELVLLGSCVPMVKLTARWLTRTCTSNLTDAAYDAHNPHLGCSLGELLTTAPAVVTFSLIFRFGQE